ncbi:MAG: hypothetical protein LBE04_02375 [Prevotellaceae bacterium]|nr:hypothetical protein [Prevotellaceae bacterium]
MKFIDGTPENTLKEPNSVVITRRYVDIMFGSVDKAMGNQMSVHHYTTLTVSGIIKELLDNTHLYDMK